MKIGSSITEFTIDHPRGITWFMVLATVLIGLTAALPSIWPQTFSMLNPLSVDTDPENMLPEDEAIRVFHNEMKREMALSDMVVLGVVNEHDEDGVFNPESLARIHALAEYAKTLHWEDDDHPGEMAGVIEVDIIAPSTVDNIEQAGLGAVRFEWLMAEPPTTRAEALAVRHKAERIPFLNGTVLSEDGKALCIYLPLTTKHLSNRVREALQEKIDTFSGDDEYHITGLPVAEDTFGVEMFKQMAISAPIAMVIIFIIMLVFFKKISLVLSAMIVAMVSVIWTMGILIATGNTVHIMSSMIPIFIMPIAVLDAVHVLSEFFDRYRETQDRRQTITGVMDTLFSPMLYTTLTTAVGFGSLALTPIPPVQVFGIFVAIGVFAAWVWTILFIPAFIMLLGEKSLENFGNVEAHGDSSSLLSRLLAGTGRLTYTRAPAIMVVVVVLSAIAVYGIRQIDINDNPVKWFSKSHPIRVADRVLNEHFGGTYMAYLALEAADEALTDQDLTQLATRMDDRAAELADFVDHTEEVFGEVESESRRRQAASSQELLNGLAGFARERRQQADEDRVEAWDEALLFLDEEAQKGQIFKDPQVLAYVEDLQQALLATDVVGKSNSLTDIVKTVYRELLSGEESDFRIPATPAAVGQCLIQYQNSHRPHDLWHLVTPDYRKSVLWVQLKSGDNRDMVRVVEGMAEYVAANPPPVPLEQRWFGLTYINVVWQDKMVSGMLQAFLGSFLIVFLMMTILYRSALWGLLSMVPLTVTIGLIYGAIGLVGKDYDMPVAVLSSLSLGLAVDYAIHFLTRSRDLRGRHDSWREAIPHVFGEPARAIARNVIVVGVGFLPLLAAPLVPYQTVGIFIALILLTAGVASLFILPSLITLLERGLFPRTRACSLFCSCTTCVLSAVAAVAVVVMNVHRFVSVGWTALTGMSLVAIVIMAGICYFTSRREKCLAEAEATAPTEEGGGQ